MRQKTILLFAFVLMLFPVFAYAIPSAPDFVAAAIKNATNTVFNDLQKYAIRMLAILILLQFTISNIKLIGQASDIDRFFAKLLGSLFWFSFCYIVMFDGSSFLYTATDSFFQKSAGWSATKYFNATDVMFSGFAMFGNVLHAISNFSSPDDSKVLGLLNIFPALMSFFVGLVILITCAIIAIKLFMIKIEMGIVIAMSPLSFSLLGLDALKEQGIAPFKYLIAIIYRVVILAMIIAAMQTVADTMTQVLNGGYSGDQVAAGHAVVDVWSPIFAGLFGYVLLAFVAIKSDGIASSLASGSSNLSSGDMAGAVGTGVAAGMAVATGGVAAVAMASSGIKSGSDFMKSLGKGVEMTGASGGSNGGSGGSGSSQENFPPPQSPESAGASQAKTEQSSSASGAPLPIGNASSAALHGHNTGTGGHTGGGSLAKEIAQAISEGGKQTLGQRMFQAAKTAGHGALNQNAQTSAHISTHGD